MENEYDEVDWLDEVHILPLFNFLHICCFTENFDIAFSKVINATLGNEIYKDVQRIERLLSEHEDDPFTPLIRKGLSKLSAHTIPKASLFSLRSRLEEYKVYGRTSLYDIVESVQLQTINWDNVSVEAMYAIKEALGMLFEYMPSIRGFIPPRSEVDFQEFVQQAETVESLAKMMNMQLNIGVPYYSVTDNLYNNQALFYNHRDTASSTGLSTIIRHKAKAMILYASVCYSIYCLENFPTLTNKEKYMI